MHVKWYNNLGIVILLLLFLGYLGWVLHASLESLFSPDKTFLQLLITDASLSDIILRCSISGCFIFLGIIVLNIIANSGYSEEQLKKTNETLREKNSVLEQQVKAKAQEVQQLLKQKNELLMGLSHDLNTPLTPLMGFLPFVIKEEKDPKLKELLEINLKNVHYIRDLVSNTINLALLDSTILGLSPEKIHLLSEVETVLEHRSSSLSDHFILVHNKIDECVFVNADKMKLREVLNNLLMNSIQYTPSSGGTITINAVPQKDHIKVSITDTGIGLTPEQLEHIFDELYKADPARHDHSTKGLGLTICKRIIEKHGGKIWAESPGKDKGTTVYFTLPRYNET